MPPLTYDDIKTARDRIAGHVRPTVVAPFAPGVWNALEFTQHTGSFKARGAWNFVAAHREAGTLPDAGVTIASGGNAGLACAWAAREAGVPATVFLPQNAPRVKVDRLAEYGARVRLVGREYAEAAASCAEYAADSGALLSHAYDDALIAAGAGTLLDEVREQVPGLTTVVVAVGGGGLFAGVATAAHHHGIRAVGVEPAQCAALAEALKAGEVVDVVPDSVAADSLGARRATELALHAARDPLSALLTVPDEAIIRARRDLWDHHRLAVEHAAATALSALTTSAYTPHPDERVAVILCGANTDPATLSDNR
ncbi:putative threonine dehydratase [Streptomyces sp. Tu6071]|uniref:serine/threonine dehydratase n=1 Tax=unclassified Streptomyces TaxID=2593676 RepID=UPI00020E590D|nr:MULTISPECIES: serine/threonine dehydratase [unclassified Streptomyces]ASY33635.1 threonine dehydratase [Streptomyces sp. CLI2509]EGJ75757.1 putative threonine dehydratase [Streptomyces sp. Tu6071]MYX23628.1 pyridoxal-phosphate dependent enzyme [Streptomyces sp. SID8380]